MSAAADAARMHATGAALDRLHEQRRGDLGPPLPTLVSASALVTCMRPPDWLIRDLIERDAIGTVIGEPGTCKSFIAGDIGLCVAADHDYHGHPVKQGVVVYVVGEGRSGIARRVKAWALHHDVDLDGIPFYITTAPVRFLNREEAEGLRTAVLNIAGDRRVALVIVDTLARNFGSGDENSTKDMGQFLDHLTDCVRVPLGATVLVVHHVGHGDKSRARGASALFGGVDFEYRAEKPGDGIVMMRATKMKDAELPAPITFRTVRVDLGIVDDDLRPVTSLTLERTDYTPPQEPTGRRQRELLEIVRALAEEQAERLAIQGYDVPAQILVREDDARARFYELNKDGKRDTNVRTFSRAWPAMREMFQPATGGILVPPA